MHDIRVPIPSVATQPRIYEKFAMQKCAWQLLLVLMLPLIARLLVSIIVFATHSDEALHQGEQPTAW